MRWLLCFKSAEISSFLSDANVFLSRAIPWFPTLASLILKCIRSKSFTSYHSSRMAAPLNYMTVWSLNRQDSFNSMFCSSDIAKIVCRIILLTLKSILCISNLQVRTGVHLRLRVLLASPDRTPKTRNIHPNLLLICRYRRDERLSWPGQQLVQFLFEEIVQFTKGLNPIFSSYNASTTLPKWLWPVDPRFRSTSSQTIRASTGRFRSTRRSRQSTCTTWTAKSLTRSRWRQWVAKDLECSASSSS